jgi:hypothetical protein
MRTRFLVAGLAVSAASFLISLESRAGTVVDFGVGLMGQAGGNFLTKPGDTTVTPGVRDETYPGFTGFTAGGGLMLDLRVLGLVGLEVDVLYASNRGTGDITVGAGGVSQTFTVDIGQPAWHVPILLKGVIPLPVVRPFAVFGPELVFPGDPTVTITPNPTQSSLTGAYADRYTMLTAGLGLEIKLPLPAIDLRIPLSLRFSWNPGTSDKVTDRTQYANNAVVRYRSEWEYQAVLTAGAALYF